MTTEASAFSEAKLVVEGLRVARASDGRAERWELHNPKRRNAVTPEALRWIAERCARLDGEVVLLTSSEGPYCSGFDLQALQDALSRESDTMPDRVLIDATAAMRGARAVFIAAARRYAIGAGVELLACCDLRVMSIGSFVEVPAARLGVVYHGQGISRLRAVFGGQVATRLLAVGSRVSAEDLLAAGALSHVEEEGRVLARAEQLCASILGLDPRAVHSNLRYLRACDDARLDESLRVEHERARAQAYAKVRGAASRADPNEA